MDEFYFFKGIEDKDMVFGKMLNVIKFGLIKVINSLGYIQKQRLFGFLQVEC